jgi:hypothetical protein
MSRANPLLAGQFREVWTEHFLCNVGSFSTTFASDSWERQAGAWGPSPAQVSAGYSTTHDLTAYSTPPADGSWHDRITGYQNPARPTAPTGSFEQSRAT